MITLKEIKTLVETGKYDDLKALHKKAKIEGIENCDQQMLSTVNLCILECSMFGEKSQGHLRSLLAMLGAVERGNHPYDDIIAMSTINAEAAIATAQLKAVSGNNDKSS